MLDIARKGWNALLDAIDEAERESLMEQVAHPSRKLNGEVIGVVTLACVMLTVLEFYGSSGDYDDLANLVGLVSEGGREWVLGYFTDGEYARLHRLGYWASMTFVCYMLIPAMWVKFVMGRSLLEMGASTRGTLKHSWLYGLLYLIVLPAVYIVSGTPSFQATYPFYDQAGRSAYDFLAWELLYALQFLSLEFFFRGFLVHGLKRRFGFYAIFVSVIPYCMIHFGKPLPECFGSIIAGVVLGAFSLFTGNIWLGVLIHVSVAVSMDIFALM